VSEVSVVVPVLNEVELIASFLAHLAERAPGAEVIVADGGSEDGTAERAAGEGARVVRAPRGRAVQMNVGAAQAGGRVLWFLHADSRLPPEPLREIARALEDPRLAAGCFRLRIPRPDPIYRVSDTLGNLGVDLFRIALGDHGIFCRREAFEAVGGYPPVPLMEDAELYRRLRRQGQVRQLRPSIETSPRRYQELGPYRTTLVYGLILACYAAGVSPVTLSRLYHRMLGR
jgi:rSAM/selenodomain-associated transferase 2